MPSRPFPASREYLWSGPSGPNANATFVICVGLGLAWMNLPAENPEAIFSSAANVVGAVLVLAILLEARAGARGLLRADIMMMLALYVHLGPFSRSVTDQIERKIEEIEEIDAGQWERRELMQA